MSCAVGVEHLRAERHELLSDKAFSARHPAEQTDDWRSIAGSWSYRIQSNVI